MKTHYSLRLNIIRDSLVNIIVKIYVKHIRLLNEQQHIPKSYKFVQKTLFRVQSAFLTTDSEFTSNLEFRDTFNVFFL